MVWLARNWWVLALRGVASIVFGITALAWPGVTLEVLVLFFGAYAFADGLFALGSAMTYQENRQNWWALLLEGFVGIALGIATLMSPVGTIFGWVLLIGTWAIITGILEIVAAIRLRAHIENEIWLGLSGIESILFGMALLSQPGAGVYALVWIIGGYAIVFGALMLVLSLRIRAWGVRHARRHDLPLRV